MILTRQREICDKDRQSDIDEEKIWEEQDSKELNRQGVEETRNGKLWQIEGENDNDNEKCSDIEDTKWLREDTHNNETRWVEDNYDK